MITIYCDQNAPIGAFVEVNMNPPYPEQATVAPGVYAPTVTYPILKGVLAAIAFVIYNRFTASVLLVPATKSVIF